MNLKKIFDKTQADYALVFCSFIAAVLLILLTFFGFPKQIIAAAAIIGYALIAIKELYEKRKISSKEAENKMDSNRIKAIHMQLTEKQKVLETKQSVIRKFLNKGVVKENELISSLNQESFIMFYHYNRALDLKFVPHRPNNKRLAELILNELGFVPVGATHGSKFFHIVSTKSLPRDLQSIMYLEAYIKKRAAEYWNELELNLRKSDSDLHKKFVKNEKLKGNLTYFIGKVFPANMSVGYLNFHSFDPKFLPYYSQFVNPANLNLDVQKLNDIIELASIDFFIDEIEPKDRKIILKNETAIKEYLQIKKLFDYETISKERWVSCLDQYFNKEKAVEYSNKIMNSIQKSCPIIKEFL